MKILLAVDGSNFTQRMLDFLAKHEAIIGPGKEVSVITAVTSVPPHVTGYIDKASLQQYYTDEAETVLKPVRAFAEAKGWKANFITATGNAARHRQGRGRWRLRPGGDGLARALGTQHTGDGFGHRTRDGELQDPGARGSLATHERNR